MHMHNAYATDVASALAAVPMSRSATRTSKTLLLTSSGVKPWWLLSTMDSVLVAHAKCLNMDAFVLQNLLTQC